MSDAKAFVSALFALPAFANEFVRQETRDAVVELFDDHTSELRAENVDLHLVAQGIKHYWGCAKLVDECLRCEAERLAVERDALKARHREELAMLVRQLEARSR